MNVSWSYQLKPTQLANPVIYHEMVELPEGLQVPDDSTLQEIFPGGNHSLKTWGRTEGTLVFDPHWIGVRKQTPLHIDPRYPQYSHHLVLRADDLYLWGMSKTSLDIKRGSFYILDGHSPHQLCEHPRPKGSAPAWYVAVSMDSQKTPIEPEVAIPQLLAYALRESLDNR